MAIPGGQWGGTGSCPRVAAAGQLGAARSAPSLGKDAPQ